MPNKAALAVLVLWAARAGGVCTASTKAAYECQQTEGDVTIFWKLSADQSSVDLAAEVTADGYLALGFGTAMPGSEVMIGEGSAALYSISGKTGASIAVASDDSFISSSQVARSGGKTLLTFTRTIAGGTVVITASSAQMVAAYHATSVSKNQKHTARSIFTINFSDPAPAVSTTSTTAASTSSATPATPTATSPTTAAATSLATPTATSLATPTATSLATPTATSLATPSATSLATPTATSPGPATTISTATAALGNAACTASSDASYTCMEPLLSGAITVHWKLSADEASVSFMAVSTGGGYLALGFGTSMSSSTGAIITQVSTPALHTLLGQTTPTLAISDTVGYTDLSQTRAAGTTALKFTRPTQGLDLAQLEMMAAYHSSSETLTYHSAQAAFTLQLSADTNSVSATAICYVGYIMDRYCIERGTLLDNSAVKTLEGPDQHTVHCLVDMQSCRNSGYEILVDNSTAGGTYCRAYRLDAAGTAKVIEHARTVGSCSTCDGSGTLEKGYRATIKGTLQDASVSPAKIVVTEVLAASVGCGAAGPSVPDYPNCGKGDREVGAMASRPSTATTPPTPSVAPERGCTESTLQGSSEDYACELEMGGGATMHYGESVAGKGRRVALEVPGAGWYALAWAENAGAMVPAAALVLAESSSVRRVSILGRSVDEIGDDSTVLPAVKNVTSSAVNGKRVLSFSIAGAQTSRRGAAALANHDVVDFNWARSPGALAYHGASRGSKAVNFETGTLSVEGVVPGKTRAHAIIMFILWGVLMPCGVLVKRFGALCIRGKMSYAAHAGMMAVVVVVTTAMAVVAFSDLHGESAHRRLGITIFAAMWVQVILAVAKAAFLGPNNAAAKFVGWTHALLGCSLHVLVVAQMLVGARDYNSRFIKDQLGDRIKWTVIACVVAFVVANVIGYVFLMKMKAGDTPIGRTAPEPEQDVHRAPDTPPELEQQAPHTLPAT